MACCHRHAPHNLREIQFLPEGEPLHRGPPIFHRYRPAKLAGQLAVRSTRAQHLSFVRDQTSGIANLGITQARIAGNGRDDVVQHRLSRRIRPLMPEAPGQTRADLPGWQGLAPRCKRRIEALQAPLEIGKGAIALRVCRARQQHMGLLTAGEAIRRLHDQAVEPGRPTRHRLGTKRRGEIDPNGVQHFDRALVNRLRQRRQLRRSGWRREPHILRSTRIRVLVGPDQEIVLVPRDARVQEHMRSREDLRRQSDEEITVFVRPLGGHYDADRRPTMALDRFNDVLQRRRPAAPLQPATLLELRVQHTVVIDRFIAKASCIADPGLVHRLIVPWFEAIHVPIMVMDTDVATTRTSRADRFRLLQEPHPNLEAKILTGQGTNGTDIDRISSIGISEFFAWEGSNLHRIATLKEPEFIGLADLVAETYAARAQDTPFRVKDHIRTKVHDLAPMNLFFLETAVVETILHVIVLQPTLAGLVTDGTIQRMIDEQEFKDPTAALDHPGGIRVHHHIIRHRRVAANFQFRAPLQLDEAHTAIAGDAQFGVIAIVRNDNAGLVRRLDNRGIIAGRNVLAVNGQLFCHDVCLSAPQRSSPQRGKEPEGKLWRFYLGAALSDVHRPITARLTNEMGVRYFQHMPMSWSTRRRGSVQRIHIMTKTRQSVLVRNQKGPAMTSGTKVSVRMLEKPPR